MIVRKPALVLVLAFAFCSLAFASEPADPVFDRLAKVGIFAFGGVGFAGITSRGELDYKIIFSRPTALRDFERLYAVGTPQAQCYALVGIHILDPKKFQELAKSLTKSTE